MSLRPNNNGNKKATPARSTCTIPTTRAGEQTMHNLNGRASKRGSPLDHFLGADQKTQTERRPPSGQTAKLRGLLQPAGPTGGGGCAKGER
eukprot:7070389-Lingulodinium_polyedra.AAC.1